MLGQNIADLVHQGKLGTVLDGAATSREVLIQAESSNRILEFEKESAHHDLKVRSLN